LVIVPRTPYNISMPSQIIGVATPSVLAGLKRQLLLVDQIAVVHDVDPQKDWGFRSEDPSLAADLDWLTEQGEVFRTDFSLKLEIGINEVEARGENLILKAAKLPSLLTPYFGIPNSAKSHAERFTVGHMLEVIDDFCCREECQALRNSLGKEAISFFTPSRLCLSGTANTTLTTVNSIIIKALPEPDPTTSLERVLEFKKDSKTRSSLIALRRWVSNLVRSNVSPAEFGQELEWLLQEYEDHMRLHELKVNKGTLETVLTVSGEIAESLVKLRLGNLTKLPFVFSERKIALLDAERSAPGREVAYIYHAHKNFR
jgi:hypothetical protein